MSAASAAEAPFKFRFLPVLTVIVLGIGLPWFAEQLVEYARSQSHVIPSMADKLGRAYAVAAVEIGLALITIGVMKWLAPGDYGLHAPEEKSYVGPAVVWGIGLGALAFFAEYAPYVLTQTAPKGGAALTTPGWLGYDTLGASVSEEVLFRALLVTYLAVAMPGRVHLRGHAMNAAGLAVAAVYALYVADWVHQPFEIALGQMAAGFVAGAAYAYWLEKSKSVLAPIAGHAVAGGAQFALLLLVVTSWR